MDLTPIFDPQGKTIGWVSKSHILDKDNQYRAFIQGVRVYSLGEPCRFLGEFEDGMLWDKQGNAVAFIEGAEDGPVTPVTENPPDPPPALPALPEPEGSYVHQLDWSKLSFE